MDRPEKGASLQSGETGKVQAGRFGDLAKREWSGSEKKFQLNGDCVIGAHHGDF